MSDTKQAEKDYMRRAATGAWEMSKPFSLPGVAVNPEETADLVHDFGVMLRALAPRTGDLILDLGSGGCWVSEWLARIDLCPVSVDIAIDMLRVGRARLPPGKTAFTVASDMESLPFASGSFDHACCLSAIHHVPSIPRALGEICRVLRADGRAVFLEPGADHSSTPVSQAAMRDFGVLEQDIVAADFMQQCAEAGFAYVQLLPLSYAVPGLGLTREQWQAWRRAVCRKRPFRAIDKMGRAVLELLGLARNGALFEESFNNHLARIVGNRVEAHPVVVAHRTMPSGLQPPPIYRCALDVRAAPEAAREGDPIAVSVAARNTGSYRWRAALGLPRPTRVGMQLLSEDGVLVERDFARARLPHDVMPGGECDVTVECTAPPAGAYLLKVDVVAEGITWFEEQGSTPAILRLVVT